MRCSLCNKEINSYTRINIEHPYYICNSCMNSELYELMEEFSCKQLELESIQEEYTNSKQTLLDYLKEKKHV